MTAYAGHLRCAAPWVSRVGAEGSIPTRAPALGRCCLGACPAAAHERYMSMRKCANCVLLCTTRESARLSQKTGLFNLRLSSDAPNLQVENEETIEALSARTKALLEGIQQRFLFARSIRADSYSFRPIGPFASPRLRSGRRAVARAPHSAHALGVDATDASRLYPGVALPRLFAAFSFHRFIRTNAIAFSRSVCVCTPREFIFENNRFQPAAASATTTRFLA